MISKDELRHLRPLRYEKRVARNRFLALCALSTAVLLGLIYLWRHNP